MTEVANAYALRAAEYAEVIGSMDVVHPADRQVVDTWAATVSGRVIDAGCGPGHWTNHLAGLGLDVRGIDLVPAFVEHARASYPGVRFDLESIDDIREPDGAIGGVLAWFSTIHHDPSRIGVPFAEFARVLRPGGTLVLGFFDGTAIDAFDHAVVRAYRWPVERLRERLDPAGFDVIETHRRSVRGERPVGTLVCRRRASTLR